MESSSGDTGVESVWAPRSVLAVGGALAIAGIGGILQARDGLLMDASVLSSTLVGLGIGMILASLLWMSSSLRWRRLVSSQRTSISELRKDAEGLTARLRELPAPGSHVRTAERSISAIAQAKDNVKLLGINSIIPVHQGRRLLLSLLQRGGVVRVLLLGKDCAAFSEREQMEEHVSNGRVAGRLRAEQDATLATLRDLLNRLEKDEVDLLEVRVHNQRPEFSLIVSDNSYMQSTCM